MEIIFIHKDKEILIYDGPRYGPAEEQATKELLAYERNIDINDIHIAFRD